MDPRRRFRLVRWLIVLGLGIALRPALGGEPPRPKTFRVPGVYEPKNGKLVWRPSFESAVKPGWTWVPAGWVRLRSGWGFQPGFWRRSSEPARVPGWTRPRPGSGQRPVTVVMPGPAMPGVRDSGPTILQGDPDAFAGRIQGPILKPEVVQSPGQLAALIEGPIDWRSVALWRSRMSSALGLALGTGSPTEPPPATPPAVPYNSGAAGGSFPAMSPSFYIGNTLPGTTYPSVSPVGTGVPGQATYIGGSLPGTSYPSLTPAPAGAPGQSFYIGGSLPGTSYPSLLPSPGQSVGGYGYGTAPPSSTGGQAGGVTGP
jgi:hypothetical protein